MGNSIGIRRTTIEISQRSLLPNMIRVKMYAFICRQFCYYWNGPRGDRPPPYISEWGGARWKESFHFSRAEALKQPADNGGRRGEGKEREDSLSDPAARTRDSQQ